MCVIGFDGYFLNHPTQCFFSDLCTKYIYSSYSNYADDLSNNSSLYAIKIPLIGGQLAAGVLMFISCVVFIIIFAITNYQVGKATTLQNVPPVPIAVVPPSAQYVPLYMNPTYGKPVDGNPVIQSPAIRPATPLYNPADEPSISSVGPKNEVICSNCRSRFAVSTRHTPNPNRLGLETLV